MLEKRFIIENLQKTYCYKCGASFDGAKIIPITEAPLTFIAHAVCQVCKAESMVTITPAGNGASPIQSDLTGEEYKKFIGTKPVSYEELLEFHASLKKEKIWNLMHKKEPNSVKKQGH